MLEVGDQRGVITKAHWWWYGLWLERDLVVGSIARLADSAVDRANEVDLGQRARPGAADVKNSLSGVKLTDVGFASSMLTTAETEPADGRDNRTTTGARDPRTGFGLRYRVLR
jgi:hypothetical protein